MKHFKRVNEKPMNVMILNHLKEKGNITGLEAHGMYKCRSLPRRICDLKALGYIIHSVPKFDATGQRYTRYVYVGKQEGRTLVESVDFLKNGTPVTNNTAH